MNTNSDDILLLKLIKQGDQIAFRHLFYQYADSLERFITYYIHDREKSQDLVLRFKPICYGMIVAVLYYLHLS